MPDADEGPDLVVIANPPEEDKRITDGHLALATPQVILKIDGSYYLTFACWQYDPDHPDLSHEEEHAIDEIRKLYHDSDPVDARVLKGAIRRPGCSAHPHGHHPRPCKQPGKPTRPHRAEHKID